jgi:hypothetical protein
MLHQALVSHDSNKDSQNKKKHLFIDLLGYQDLQLLKAKRGDGLKMSLHSDQS